MAQRTIAIIDQALQIVLLHQDLWVHPDLPEQVDHRELAEQVAVEEEDNLFQVYSKKKRPF